MGGCSSHPVAFEFDAPCWVAEVQSTNLALCELVRNQKDIADGFVMASRHQTAGRGRFQRKWVSGQGRNLTFSFLLSSAPGYAAPGTLSMAVALGVADALASWSVEARVKWPNDVVVGGRKICGILAESQTCSNQPGAALVVGVGLNLNMTARQVAAIEQPATSVLAETGRELDMVDSLQDVLVRCEPRIRTWIRSGFEGLREEWSRRCLYLGESVSVTKGEEQIHGVLEGFGTEGELLLLQEDGTLATVWSGDVSRLRRDG